MNINSIMLQFEGLRQPDDLMRFWQNYLHPSINKSTWDQDEIAKLADISEKNKCCHWEQIAESLGVSVAMEVVLVCVDSNAFRIRQVGRSKHVSVSKCRQKETGTI